MGWGQAKYVDNAGKNHIRDYVKAGYEDEWIAHQMNIDLETASYWVKHFKGKEPKPKKKTE